MEELYTLMNVAHSILLNNNILYYASGSGATGWLSTPEGKSVINYMTNNYPVYLGGLALAVQQTAFPDMS